MSIPIVALHDYLYSPTDSLSISTMSPISPISYYDIYDHNSPILYSDTSSYDGYGTYGTIDQIISPNANYTKSKINFRQPHPMANQIKPITITSHNFGNPYVASLNTTYTQPTIGIYEDINYDPKIQSRIINYFHKLTLDKWLMGDLSYILSYFSINDKGEVNLIKSANPTKNDRGKQGYDKNNIRDAERIIDFIEKYFLTKSVVRRVLDVYVSKTGDKWVYLHRHKGDIKRLMENKLIKLIETALSQK